MDYMAQQMDRQIEGSVSENEKLRDAIAGLAKLVSDAQAVLASYLPPDGISKDEALSKLLYLLDGPQSRSALAAADPHNRAGLIEELVEALRGIIRVADRNTDEFNFARAALSKATGSEA